MSSRGKIPPARWFVQLALGVTAGLVLIWGVPDAPLWQRVAAWFGFWILLSVRDAVLR